MKIINHVKPYSWLQWPVRLKNCDKPSLHITAKFFGRTAIDPEAIRRRVDVNQFLPHKQFAWNPEVFSDLIPVLELTSYPAAIVSTRQTFDIIKNQFEPYRPHITVPKEYWAFVNLNNIPIQEELLSIGELELWLGQVFND